MIISRSTDLEMVFFHYCFKQPSIQSVTPNPFPLTGSLLITGSDFSTNFEFLSVLSNFPQTVVSNYTHDEIILHVPYICNITSTKFEIFLIIGNQSSNSFQLNFGPPIVAYKPVPLSPSGEIIDLFDTNFSKMFNCFSNSSIEFSIDYSTFQILSDDDMNVITGDLYGLTEFVIAIEFFNEFNFFISIPVTSFIARNTPFVCFVGIACEIEVYSYMETFSFLQTFIEPNVPDSIYILYFQFNFPQNLKICSSFGCFSIFNFPFVVEPSYITPTHVQWLNQPTTSKILVEIAGISFYSFSVIQNSFYFDSCQSWLSEVTESTLIFDVELSSTGNCSLMGVSFLDILPLSLSVEVQNFLIFPPEVSSNSRVEFILAEDINDLFITFGTQKIAVRNGANYLNLKDSSTYITLHKFSQSTNISVVNSEFFSRIPEVIELNYSQSSLINLTNSLYTLDVQCYGHCHLDVEFVHESTAVISITGNECGLISLEFIVFYRNSNFNFRFLILVENPHYLNLSVQILLPHQVILL
ncbi:hypothetical protein GEMRC1_013959 [Eukaryota sp. GEM-RC1]